ncbi:MAG: hypothetical protein ACRDQE_14575 [Gaiellales bacterium]
MLNPALFALVGVAFLLHWILADPGFEASNTQDDWRHVIGFSAALLSLAVALTMFGQLIGRRDVLRVSVVAAAGAALSSAANIVEDGLGMGWAFYVFVLGTGALGLGLVALTAAIATLVQGNGRLTALIPAGTLAALLFYVHAGGPVMFATWLAAAAFAIAATGRPRERLRG